MMEAIDAKENLYILVLKLIIYLYILTHTYLNSFIRLES